MNIRFNLYEIYRNGNWELFCCLKQFVYNPKTWEEDCATEYDLTPEEIVILGLHDLVKRAIEAPIATIESIWQDTAAKIGLNMDEYAFFPAIRGYRNTSNESIYAFLPEDLFSDLSADITDIAAHILKNSQKILQKVAVKCPSGCPLGSVKYKKIIEAPDLETAQQLWDDNTPLLMQADCKNKQGELCMAKKNYMKRFMTKNWQYAS